MPRVAIIGAGITGLAAAHRLQTSAPDIQVSVFDANRRAGGVIRSQRQEGLLIESAAENFMIQPPAALELCQQLGLEDQLLSTNPRGRGAMVVHGGKLLPIPKGFLVMAPSQVWPMVSTGILSPLGKLRCAAEYFVPRRKSGGDESLKSFVCRRFGSQLFERIVQPLVGGIYTANPAKLSLAATMPRFQKMECEYGSLIRAMRRTRRGEKTRSQESAARYSQFVTLRGGMQTLVDSLTHSLPPDALKLNSPVLKVMSQSGSGDGVPDWRIRIDRTRSPWIDADAVIVAAPAHHAANILLEVDPLIAQELGEVEYASSAIASLAFPRKAIQHPLDSFGFLVPQAERRWILSCTFSSMKYEGRAPDDTVLMRVYIGGACQPGLLGLSSNELLDLAEGEVKSLLRISGAPVFRKLIRHSAVMPQYHVGHLERVACIERRLTNHPTLALAGSGLHGVGVPACIESGQKAAERVLRSLADSNNQQTQNIQSAARAEPSPEANAAVAEEQAPLVYACSGCSEAGSTADQLARQFARRGVAEMSCLAGLGAGNPNFLKQTRGRKTGLSMDARSIAPRAFATCVR